MWPSRASTNGAPWCGVRQLWHDAESFAGQPYRCQCADGGGAPPVGGRDVGEHGAVVHGQGVACQNLYRASDLGF